MSLRHRSYLLTATVGLALVVMVATTATAFDGYRKGFILGGGLGFGLTNFSQELNDMSSDSETNLGVGTDFVIGGGINEKMMIHWVSKVAWTSMENVFGNSVTIASGFGGAALTGFINEVPPSLYWTVGLGFTSWSAPFESGSTASYGFGLLGGLGYEFTKHWTVEGGVTYGQPKETEGSLELTTKALNFTVVVKVLGY
jgi:opacity protein-like surface antigen